ncbi:MAG: hypothetical protein JNM99_17130 [Verrucomicrobiaceae bacterium]|nr:hypothetical protein [Verrucomicrobiaceae bacterium]
MLCAWSYSGRLHRSDGKKFGFDREKARESFAEESQFTSSGDPGVQAMQSIADAKQRRFALLSNLTRLAVSDLDLASLLPTDVSLDAVLRD